ERLLLCGAVPLSVLLAMPRQELRPRDVPARRLVVEPLASVPDPLDPGRIPRDLLLLPQGVLSIVLRLAAGLRREGHHSELHGRDALPVHPAEHPPLLLLVVDPRARVPVARRGARVRLRRPLRHGPRHARAANQRDAAVAVFPLLPFVPASV